VDVDEQHAVVHVVDELLLEQRDWVFDVDRVGRGGGCRYLPGQRLAVALEPV
jgi:hypothetical protein